MLRSVCNTLVLHTETIKTAIYVFSATIVGLVSLKSKLGYSMESSAINFIIIIIIIIIIIVINAITITITSAIAIAINITTVSIIDNNYYCCVKC